MAAAKYVPPLDALVANVVARLDAEAMERFQERAGIIQEGVQLSRGHAEALALLDLLQRQPWWLTGLIALQIERAGTTDWLVTTDVIGARHYLARTDYDEVALLDPAEVVRSQYGDVAMLTTPG